MIIDTVGIVSNHVKLETGQSKDKIVVRKHGELHKTTNMERIIDSAEMRFLTESCH